MIVFIFIFLMAITTCNTITLSLPYKALVIVPVADLIGQPMYSLYPKHIKDAYNNIPLCGAHHNRWHACPRTEQLLFNEIVDVIEQQGCEVKVYVSHSYYITQKNNTKQAEYWTLSCNVIPLSTLIASGVDIRMLPKPFDFNSIEQCHQATIALAQPYYDEITQLHFSAGTRFICAKTPTNHDYFNVFAFNTAKHRMEKIKIPKKITITYTITRTPQDIRALFVSLARQWTRMRAGFIPYVWGGCSVIHPYKGAFNECTTTYHNQSVSFFDYPQCKQQPHTGLDCSGLVRQAAQLAGIPYFYKNTYTIAQHAKPLQKNDQLQIGDLIWTPGHIMIVSDIGNNLLIEARSYFQGYGKVHEIGLSNVFKNINTYDDLLHCFFNKKTIERIDIQGVVRNVLPDFLILSLDTVLPS